VIKVIKIKKLNISVSCTSRFEIFDLPSANGASAYTQQIEVRKIRDALRRETGFLGANRNPMYYAALQRSERFFSVSSSVRLLLL